jgi:hypothetical protein
MLREPSNGIRHLKSLKRRASAAECNSPPEIEKPAPPNAIRRLKPKRPLRALI